MTDDKKILDDIAALKEVAHKEFLKSIQGEVEKSRELVKNADQEILKHKRISEKIRERIHNVNE